MSKHVMRIWAAADRRTFSIIPGNEVALVQLWCDKRGGAGPEDLSGNLVVQLGTATKLNRREPILYVGAVVSAAHEPHRHSLREKRRLWPRTPVGAFRARHFGHTDPRSSSTRLTVGKEGRLASRGLIETSRVALVRHGTVQP
jgi:hypothetical protein